MNDIVMLKARSDIYRLSSLAFLEPTEELGKMLADSSFIQSLNKALTCLALTENLSSSTVATDTESEFRAVFGHTVSSNNPPYETEYSSPNVFHKTQELADIAAFYAAFGLEISEKNRQRVDHISVELEFMHFLLEKEVHALEGRVDTSHLDLTRDAQQKFLKDHMKTWVPVFCEKLLSSHPDTFYGKMAGILREFLASEGV